MSLKSNEDMIIMIDMVNGFTYEGAFASENIVKLISKIKHFVQSAIDEKIEVVHYVDEHDINASEFNSYPVHCLKGTSECLIVSELDLDKIEVIKKNSTNGFFIKNPFDYQKNIYIVGCVTDICVFEFALSAQKYNEEFELGYTINVVADLVDTFDAPNHDSKAINKQFFELLKMRGVNIIENYDTIIQ